MSKQQMEGGVEAPHIFEVETLSDLKFASLSDSAVPLGELTGREFSREANQQILEDFYRSRGVDFDKKMEYAKMHYPGFLSKIEVPDDYANVAVAEYRDKLLESAPPEEAEALQWIIENTDYISFEKFLETTAGVVKSVELEIERTGQGRDVILCDNRGKSQGWLAAIAWPLMGSAPTAIENVMQGKTSGDHLDTDAITLNLTKEQLEGSSIVIMDDGSYSGTQLARNIRDIYREAKSLGASDVHLVVGVNVFTENAKRRLEDVTRVLGDQYPEFSPPSISLGKQIKTCGEKCAEQEVSTNLSGRIHRTAVKFDGVETGIMGRSLVSAAHKVPDSFSAFQVQKVQAEIDEISGEVGSECQLRSILHYSSPPYKPANQLAEGVAKQNSTRIVDLLARHPEIDLSKKAYESKDVLLDLLNGNKDLDIPVVLHKIASNSDYYTKIEDVQTLRGYLSAIDDHEEYSERAIPFVEQILTQRPDCLSLMVSSAAICGQLEECAGVISKMTEEGRGQILQMISSDEVIAPEVRSEILDLVGTDVSIETTRKTKEVVSDKDLDIKIVSMLLDHGFDHEMVDDYGETSLIQATWRGDVALMALLLEHGANPDMTDAVGRTSLTTAIENKDMDAVALLLERGANPNIPDKRGRTPLVRAAENKDMDAVALLLEHGANPDIPDKAMVRNKDSVISFIKDAMEKKSQSVDSAVTQEAADILRSSGMRSSGSPKSIRSAAHSANKRADGGKGGGMGGR